MENKVKLIVDTDLGADCDDVGALCVAFELVKEGYCDLLAVGYCVLSNEGLTNIDILKNYYHMDYKIGQYKGYDFKNDNYRHLYDKAIIKKYRKYRSKDRRFPEAYKLYRKILAEAEDKSITIVTIGQLSNLAALLLSGPDRYSRLTGRELVKNKVKEIVTMGGLFIDDHRVCDFDRTGFGEYNLSCDIRSTKHYLNMCPVSIKFLDFYDGVDVVTVEFSTDENIKRTPLTDSYKFHSNGGRYSWDLLTVYYAVMHEYYDEKGPITISLGEDGFSHYKLDKNGRDYYLRPNVESKTIKDKINNLLLKLEERANG